MGNKSSIQKEIPNINLSEKANSQLLELFHNYLYNRNIDFIMRDEFIRILQLADKDIFEILFEIFHIKHSRFDKIINYTNFKELYYCFTNNDPQIKIILISFLLFNNNEKINLKKINENMTKIFKNNEIYNTLMEIILSQQKGNNINKIQNVTQKENDFSRKSFIQICNNNKNLNYFRNFKFINNKFIGSSKINLNNKSKLNFVCDCCKKEEITDNLDDMKKGYELLTNQTKGVLLLTDFEQLLKNNEINEKLINLVIEYLKICTQKDYCSFNDIKYIFSNLRYSLEKIDKKKFLFIMLSTIFGKEGKMTYEQLYKFFNLSLETENSIKKEDNDKEINTDSKNLDESINFEGKYVNLNEFLTDNNSDKFFSELNPHLELFGLLPYTLFKAKTNDKIIKRRIIKDTLKNRKIDNHENYLELKFDDCNNVYLLDIKFWNALINENEEIPDYIDNSRIAEEINIIKEEDKFYQEENDEETKKNIEKKSKEEKKKNEKNKEKNNNKENNINNNKEENSKKEESDGKEIKQIVTKRGRLKKGLKYKEDFIVLCEELYDIIKNNYQINFEINIKKICVLYLLNNNKEEKEKDKENDGNIKEDKKEEEDKKNEEEYKIKEKKAKELLNKYNVDIEKGLITKIIKDKNNNYISEILDFYPIQIYETSFGQMVRTVEKAKVLYDDIEEKRRIKKLPKKERKQIENKKKKEELELIKKIKKVRGLVKHYNIEYNQKLITKEEYLAKQNEIKEKYSEAFQKPEKSPDMYETDITINQFKDNLFKYRNTILLEKSDKLLTFSRYRTCKEITDEVIMNNPKLKERKFEVYYFLFNSKKLIKPEDDYLLGKEEGEDFINIIIDIHNDKDLSFYKLLEDKQNLINAQNKDDNKEDNKNEEIKKGQKEEKEMTKEEKKELKEKQARLEKERKEKEKEQKRKEKEEKEEYERKRKEEEKRLIQLEKEMRAKEKEEMKKRKQKEKEMERERERKLEKEKYIEPPYGINNYGNTCYFNSVNQIFLNLPILQQIFLDPKIEYFVNKTNKFGRQGKFFEIYKSLYWIKPHKVGDTVKSLKNLVGKIKEDFNNHEQQDANEYLNFVIENLHEELNLHSTKQYIEEKDDIFKHNTDKELGNISWANNLRRNTSFIDSIFMFQLKSNLKCKKCNTMKINFETNYIFDLPLSLCKMVTVQINLYRLPFRYKLYFNKINSKFDEYIKKEENKNINLKTNLWNYYTNILTIEEKKEHCIKVNFSLDLEREKKMLDITKIIREIKPLQLEPVDYEVTIDNEKLAEYKVKHLTDFITYSGEKNIIIFPNSYIDKYVNSNDNMILNIYEVLNINGMKILFEEENKSNNEITNDLILYSYLLKKEININFSEFRTQMKQTNYYIKNNDDKNNTINSSSEEEENNNIDKNRKKSIDNNIINKNANILCLKEYMIYFSKNKIDKESANTGIRSEFVIPIFHYFRSNKNSVYLFRDFYHTKISQFPIQYIILNNSYNISAKQLYEYIWYLNTIYMNHPNRSTQDFWWNNLDNNDFFNNKEGNDKNLINSANNKNINENNNECKIIDNNSNDNKKEENKDQKGDKKYKKICYPFVLRYTEVPMEKEDYHINLINCPICPWYSFCPGCTINPNDNLEKLNSNFGIVVDWCNSFIDEEFIPQNFKLLYKEISNQEISENLPLNDKDENNKSINDCFDLFFAEENLDDTLYCQKCHDHEAFTKKYEINRLPYVLILSLKRFKYNENSNFKLRQLITYPFDLELGGENYSLYGVINHYGSINSGHYTCIIKKVDKWFICDDSSVYEIEKKRVVNSNAYILFYINKKSPYQNDYFRFMKSLMNNIIIQYKDDKKEKISDVTIRKDKNFFRGEPVKTEYGEGYVKEDNIEEFIFDEKYDIYVDLRKRDLKRIENIIEEEKEEEKKKKEKEGKENENKSNEKEEEKKDNDGKEKKENQSNNENINKKNDNNENKEGKNDKLENKSNFEKQNKEELKKEYDNKIGNKNNKVEIKEKIKEEDNHEKVIKDKNIQDDKSEKNEEILENKIIEKEESNNNLNEDNNLIQLHNKKEEYYKNFVRIKFDYGEAWLNKNKVQKYNFLKLKKENTQK